MIQHRKNLNLIPGRVPERIKVNQFDHDKNALEFTIYNGASLFVAPSGATVMIEGHKADGTGFQYEAVIEGSVVIADLEEQMTVVAGETVTELVIRDSAGNRIGTANFILDVEPAALGDDTVISETDLPMIQKAANNVDLIMEKSAQVQADAAQVASDKAAAQTARTGAETARTGAETAQAAAETAQEAAKAAQTAAETAKTGAQTAQGLAETARTGAETAQTAAETAQGNAEDFAEDAEAWATGKRGGVAVPATDETYHNNSEYYAGLAHDAADEAQRIVDDLGYPINPKGSITFANLPTSGMEYGWMYNVTDDFTTDSRFVEGSGIRYNGGAEVYWTSQNKWSVMAGAGVTGVKGAAETTYRKGQINITPENIGLGNVNNTSDADKPISTAQQAALDEKVNWSEQNILGAKNLIPYPYKRVELSGTTYTANGITFTVEDDNSVTLNGTATAGAEYTLVAARTLTFLDNGKKYTASLEGDVYGIQMSITRQLNGTNINPIIAVNDTEVEFIQDDSFNQIWIYIWVTNGTTFDQVNVKPMLRLASIADDTYAPYAKTNKQLTDDITSHAELISANAVNIESNADAIADIVNVYGSKNLLPYPYYYTTITTNGITFTDNGDGSVTVNGTNTSSSAIHFGFYNTLGSDWIIEPNTKYIVSFELKNTNNLSFYVNVNNTDIAAIRNKSTGYYEAEFTTPDTYTTRFAIAMYISANLTETNAIVYPMLRLASIEDPTYVPYVQTNKELMEHTNEALVRIGKAGKNLIPYPYYSPSGKVNRGVTFTYDSDGVVTCNGTSTNEQAYIILNRHIKLEQGVKYILSAEHEEGCFAILYFKNSDYTDNRVDVNIVYENGVVRNATNANYASLLYSGTYHNSAEITVSATTYADIQARVNNNVTVENAIIKPMLRLASITDDTWEPYSPTLEEANKQKITWEANGILGAKNLIPYPYSDATITKNRMTFTDNGDGSVTVNGTATASTSYYFTPIDWYQDIIGRFILSSGGTELTNSFKMTIESPAGTNYNLENSGELTVNLTATTRNIRLFISSGTTVNNVTVYPMLRLAEDTE